jgi:hypothetical protein
MSDRFHLSLVCGCTKNFCFNHSFKPQYYSVVKTQIVHETDLLVVTASEKQNETAIICTLVPVWNPDD